MKYRDSRVAAALFAALGLFCLLTGCSGGGDNAPEPRSEADLPGYTIACTNGNYYHAKFSKREDLTVFAANTEADAVQALRQGIADIYVGDEVALSPEDQRRLGVKIAFLGEDAFDVAFAMKKGSDALKRQLDDFLAAAPLKEIIAQWLEGGPVVEEPAYEISPDAEPLRCITCVNLAPVSYPGDGGEWMGMDPDILRRFAHAIGRPFEMKFQDQGSAIIALQTGQADIMSACLYVTEERKKSVDFSANYYKCHPAYFIKDSGRSDRPGFVERLKRNLVVDNRWKMIVDGLVETLKITFFSILLGTLLGAGVCSLRRSRKGWMRSAASLYGALINGIPTLVLLLIMYYVVFAGSGVGATLVAIFTFSLCFASAAGNIFDTSISSVPRGQTEAGLSLGFTPLKTFLGIVFPQALKKGLPLYSAECVSLLKATSIVGYIAIQDITRASDFIRSRTFDAVIPLLIVTILYFLIAWVIRRLLKLILVKK